MIYPDGRIVDYLATSGSRGWQSKDDLWARGRGPIPDGFDYQIPTTPYYLPTKGIEGNFFHITPDPVKQKNGNGTRAELGIHYDANVPGSAGCIVLKNRDGFEGFCNRMKRLADNETKTLPLTINYLPLLSNLA
ncbi:L,D-transpeptidase [Aerosakkonema sp. BLCC-F2]